MPSSIDYYSVLNITKNAKDSDIKFAYRKLALQYHPHKQDKTKSNEDAMTIFHEISEAYDVLSDHKKKAVYDLYGHKGLLSGATSKQGEKYEGNYKYSPDQSLITFRSFFGTDNVYEAVFAPGPDTIVHTKDYHTSRETPNYPTVKATLEDLYNGSVKPIMFERKIFDFEGRVTKTEEKEFQIKIKPGWKSGTKIVFQKEGHHLPSGLKDDAVFVIEEQKHDQFKRDIHDLHITKTIDLRSALTATSLNIKTLDDRNLNIIIGDIISPAYVKKIVGEGMPISGASQQQQDQKKNGDLFIHFKVDFPEYLSDQQKKQIKEILPISSSNSAH